MNFRPNKIIGIARNYRAHAAELNNTVPEEEPLFFYKPTSSVIFSGGTVILPPNVGRVDYEGELGVVISATTKNIEEEKANQVVKGLLPAFDITARALQKSKGHFSLAKGFDTFCPIGVLAESSGDGSNVRLRTYLNDERVQDSSTSNMVHSIPRLISYLSSVITLEENDLILTGTPAGVGPISSGDNLRLEIDGLSTLTCSVM
ncbi:MAG: fumarylacetoacetate hydrolase family protein [Myxococcota bacterium]|nr:fumarylacetoacetate hydrolase family protein [Myxococcota bacterium]